MKITVKEKGSKVYIDIFNKGEFVTGIAILTTYLKEMRWDVLTAALQRLLNQLEERKEEPDENVIAPEWTNKTEDEAGTGIFRRIK